MLSSETNQRSDKFEFNSRIILIVARNALHNSQKQKKDGKCTDALFLHQQMEILILNCLRSFSDDEDDDDDEDGKAGDNGEMVKPKENTLRRNFQVPVQNKSHASCSSIS